MVSHTGRTPDPRRIRRLKPPGSIEVEAARDGTPQRVRLYGRWQQVTLARRPWRIDQYWWREQPVRRDYYRVIPEEGPPLTVYRDLVSNTWARQEY
jgi:hypothetical protein